MTEYTAPLRLSLSSDALVSNWRWLDAQSGSAACGAAVKANGYGLGAIEVVERLRKAGCRDFFVATWAEAAELAGAIGDANLSVLHGVRESDMALTATVNARPVLNSAEQIARWRAAGGGACDVMVDTGMNRLGLSPSEAVSGLLDGLEIETLMSHLACADEDVPMNEAQLVAFRGVTDRVAARRTSLANSAGICLGEDYAFDLTRPGLALYGGIPRGEAVGHIRQVVTPQAEVLQVRHVKAGDSVGYGASWTAPADTSVAIVNFGYADGYPRAFAGHGLAYVDDLPLPLLGRVSMDLIALDVSRAPFARAGDWINLSFDLPIAGAQTSLSQYELLTWLSTRATRAW